MGVSCDIWKLAGGERCDQATQSGLIDIYQNFIGYGFAMNNSSHQTIFSNSLKPALYFFTQAFNNQITN